MSPRRCVLGLLFALIPAILFAADGNRLTYLDEPCNPWYPHRDFPKLTTPMWVGEEGVEAVVILGIDDMRGHEKWEAYLRPILNRLKKIDGRAPVSIFTCSIDPKQPHLQQWLEEGLSLEVHTIDHPCPLLKDGDLAKAKSTVDRCTDLLNEVPNNKPVCFRMPCCDSLNTLSPRFYTEIFNKTTPKGYFLLANSSVMHLFTSDDPALPRELVVDADGQAKFKKYLPSDRFFTNYIENYPYPFVVDRLCWEFPTVLPSDWSAQHRHKPHNPVTVADWKAALDCTVIKQGVFCLVFHPHNWIKPEQINELIDHAVTKHGKKVKFLNFREAVERLNKNVLGGQTLRDEKGNDDGVRLLDINHDGSLDVVDGARHRTRVWESKTLAWVETGFPVDPRSSLVRFVPDGGANFIQERHDGCGVGVADAATAGIWVWMGGRWQGPNPAGGLMGWPFGHPATPPTLDPKNTTMLVRDFRNRGGVSLVVTPRKLSDHENLRMRLAEYAVQDGRSGAFPVGFPEHLQSHWGSGRHGWRFVDLDEDGIDDLVFSNADEYFVALARVEKEPYIDWKRGSSLLFNVILQGKRGSKPANEELPPIVRADGSNNGFWVHKRELVWMNEDTAKSKDLVERRSFDQLLGRVQPPRAARAEPSRSDKPLSPADSLKSLRAAPGFSVELVAAEPLTMDPVAFAWGADGKFWIVEMADYPLGIPDNEPSVGRSATLLPSPSGRGAGGEGVSDRKPNSTPPHPNPLPKGEGTKRAGRVRYLEDTNGDGQYDKSTLFLDNVPYPNGVLPWRKGVLISAAPDIFYAEDTDGDGQADLRRILFTGFAPGNQQHRVNGFSYGLDNWVYLANGDSAGSVRVVNRLLPSSLGGERLRDEWRQHHLSSSPPKGERGSGGEGRVIPSVPRGEVPTRSAPHPQPLSPFGGEGGRTIDTRGRDIRIRPDTGEIDTATGQTQFGRNRDDWGNWFGCNNANPMYHFVLADHYLRRNPHVPSIDPRVHVSVTPGTAPVFPTSVTQTRFNDFHTANRFTSACSAMVYRDDLLFERSSISDQPSALPSPPGRGAGGEGASPSTQPATGKTSGTRADSSLPIAHSPRPTAFAFISEPVHNLVHREVMTAKGSTFTSQRVPGEETSEFLTSTDNWFRPTMIQTGPDGALYIADMYRHVIEHPEWIPKDWQARLDLRAGHDKGRIYRVFPTGAKLRAIPRLDKMSATELVGALDSPSGWQRDTAQRLLIERADKSSIPLLEKLAADSTRPLARLHALCTLDGLRVLDPAIVRRGLTDDHPGVRRHAVRLCESFLPSPPGRGAGGEGASSGKLGTNSKSASNSPTTLPHPNPLPKGEGTVAQRALPNELLTDLLKLTTDPDLQVRLQLACTLGEIDDPRAGQAIGELIVNHGSDRYLFAAAMSSIHKANVSDVIAAVLTNQKRGVGDRSPLTPSPSPPAGERGVVNVNLLENLMTLATALGNDAALATLLSNFVKQTDLPPKSRFEVLASLLEMLSRQKQSLASLRDGGSAELRTIALKLDDVFAAARRVAEDVSQTETDRIAAMRLLGRGLDQQSEDLARLEKLLAPQSPTELQRAAVESLGNLNQPQVPTTLLAGWKGFSPTRRGQVLDVLLSRNAWSEKLLDAVEQQRLTVADIDAARRQRLLGHGDAKLRERAQKLFAGTVNVDRKKVVEAMSSALTLTGNIDHGRERFVKTCAQCHKLAGMGHDVGPDLMSLTDKSPESLLVAMLDPNRAVEAKFLGYTAVTKSGKTVTGLISAETGGSITLLAPEGKSEVIPRAELDELVGSNKSTMPEGIEKDLVAQDFADLIAFVRSAVPLPKRKEFAGNSPAVVKPADDGSFSLTTPTCEIYGKTLVLEDQYKNLGYWSSEDDHAVWTIDLPRPGRFTVELDYAVENSSAGDLLLIQAGSEELTFRVAGTATWDNYKQRRAGEVTLPAGRHRVVCKPGGKIKSALMDLRGVTLKPAR